MLQKKISIIGFGNFAIALGYILDYNKRSYIRFWGRNDFDVDYFNLHQKNPRYLKHLKFSSRVTATKSLKELVKDSDYLFSVIPMNAFLGIFEKIKTFLHPKTIIISGSKGILKESGLTFSEAICKLLGNQIKKRLVVLSGPSFVREIIENRLTKITLAGYHKKLFVKMNYLLENFFFKLNFTYDVKGLEIAGALKNVIAMISGFLEGISFGLNGKALIISKAFREMMLFGRLKGGKIKTFLNVSVIGDTFLSATSVESRNYSFGKKFAKSRTEATQLINNQSTIEGFYTLYAIYYIGKAQHLDLPVFYFFFKIFYTNFSMENFDIELQKIM